MVAVLVPSVISYGSPAPAASMVPRLLSGREQCGARASPNRAQAAPDIPDHSRGAPTAAHAATTARASARLAPLPTTAGVPFATFKPVPPMYRDHLWIHQVECCCGLFTAAVPSLSQQVDLRRTKLLVPGRILLQARVLRAAGGRSRRLTPLPRRRRSPKAYRSRFGIQSTGRPMRGASIRQQAGHHLVRSCMPTGRPESDPVVAGLRCRGGPGSPTLSRRNRRRNLASTNCQAAAAALSGSRRAFSSRGSRSPARPTPPQVTRHRIDFARSPSLT